MVMLKGKIYDFGDKPLPTHLRSMGDELEELAFINGEDENIDEIGALLKLLANVLEDANVTGDDDNGDDT